MSGGNAIDTPAEDPTTPSPAQPLLGRANGYGGIPAQKGGPGSVADAAGSGGTDIVSLRLPASGAYLSVLRTATAGLAARLDFTLDDIEDLRIAVDEACAMLLPEAQHGSDLQCVFELSAEAIGVQVSVASSATREPSRDTFAWMVLSALAGDVDSALADGQLSIRLLKRRQARR
ncbi:hypothetical protein [Fodinicola acaciae]|uniref:hypothetical protein n=1 Tax=Fodinicola acaciae TaxID=2681555 RepID=UPI001C9E723F|nr:hypothetical protein [Fodinicola acaciae]